MQKKLLAFIVVAAMVFSTFGFTAAAAAGEGGAAEPQAPAVQYEQLDIGSPVIDGDMRTWRTNGMDGYTTGLDMSTLKLATQLVVEFAARPSGDSVFVLASETNGWWKETPVARPSGTSLTIDLPSSTSWTDFIKASQGKFSLVQWGANLQITSAHLVVPKLVVMDKLPDKLVYGYGEDIDLTGMSIWYYDESAGAYAQTALTNSNAAVNGYDPWKFGEQKGVEVVYTTDINGASWQFKTTIDVTVNPPDHDLPVTVSEISGVAKPRSGAAPASAVDATSQFTGTVSWSPEPVGGVFDELTAYTATITLTAAPYYTFDGVPANFFTVAGALSTTNAANSGVITALFPKTGGTPNKTLMRDISATEFVNEMTIGWNLGKTFDATASGSTNPETAWVNVLTTKAMIDKIADAGFDVLRIPVTWSTNSSGIYQRVGDAPDYTLNPAFLDRLEEVINWGLDDGMYVIINSHHDDGIRRLDSDANFNSDSVRYAAIWRQLSVRFQAYGDHLIFESMNEPHQGDDWTGTPAYYNNVNKYNQLVVNTIRATGGNNDKRFIMLPSYAASSSATQMNAFVLPADPTTSGKPKLIASVHAYAPYNFCLNTDSAYNQWGTDADKQELKNLFAGIDKAFVSKGIPVVLGEFGAMNKNNEAVRAIWAKYFISDAKQYGIPCVWWDNNSFSGDGEKFGLLNRAALTFPYPLVLKGLMSGLAYKVPMDLSVTPVYNAEGNKWQIKAAIKNIDRTNTAYTGTVDLISPEGYTTVASKSYSAPAYGDETVLYFDIDPSYASTVSQQTISFNYTAYDAANDKTYVGESPAVVKFGLVSKANYTPAPITVDGNLGKEVWAGNTNEIDLANGVIDTNGTLGSTLDANDLSGKGKFAWDKEYLYVALAVTDNVHYNAQTGGNIYNGDGIQVSVSPIGGSPVEMGFSLRNNGAIDEYCWLGTVTGNISASDAAASIVRDEATKQTFYEVAIKWSFVGIDGASLKADDIAQITVCLNDHDNTSAGRKFIEYGEGVAVGSKGANMGFLMLKAKLVNAVTSSNSKNIKIVESPKNMWNVTFAVTETYDDGTVKTVNHTVTIKKNGSGSIDLGNGYTLVYDIKGNGSNIKKFELKKN